MTVLGLIGAGNMGAAMVGGMIESKAIDAKDVIVSNPSTPKLEKLKQQYGLQTTHDNEEVAKKSDIIIVAVKPHLYESVLQDIKDEVKDDVIIIGIAPGQTLEKIQGYFGRNIKVVRTMPNTPALVGEGMTAMWVNDQVSEEEKTEVIMLLESLGKVEEIPESQFDAVAAVSGSSPAYIFMLIEAMADAGVLQGLKRDQAYRMAAQAVLGSAKMVLETGEHPGVLKDMVCSPGGTTIEAVKKLEECGFRNAIIQGMCACAQKSKNM